MNGKDDRENGNDAAAWWDAGQEGQAKEQTLRWEASIVYQWGRLEQPESLSVLQVTLHWKSGEEVWESMHKELDVHRCKRQSYLWALPRP